MAKKKYTVYLPVPLARRFDEVARERQGAKSALVEEALRASFEPRQHEGLEDGLARRLNELHRAVARQTSDLEANTETLALFVRYFLTVTAPIPEDDQESARLIGRKRYEVFLAEVGRRVAEGQRHLADVLNTVPADQPDLFAVAPGPVLNKPQPARQDGHSRANGQAAGPGEGGDHG